MQNRFRHTIAASFIGYIVQAIIGNFTPLLFLTFQTSYGISLDKIALLVTANFGLQMLIDLLASRFVDKIGYRVPLVAAHLCAALGLAGLTFLPELLPDPYAGLVISVMIYAVGGGLIEVLVSPLVEACPTKRKKAVMGLLHSFYCWGSLFVVLASTGFFFFFGIANWKTLALLWAVIPLFNAFYFAWVPIRSLTEEAGGMGLRRLLRNKLFWVFVLFMICAGACEQAISQWASAFAESGLGLSKTVGDLAGPCAFALLMGATRVFYARHSDRMPLRRILLLSGILCVVSYLLASLSPYPAIGLLGCALCGVAVGTLWPGTFSMAAEEIRSGGTAMFALMALAGDVGCVSGPAVVGFVSQAAGGRLQNGILAAIVFPAVLVVALLLFGKRRTPAAV
ncbi:MAG: MFS transporter [Clostridiales bacterium]|nr:MFS transporter [Clostridiales bacterium]